MFRRRGYRFADKPSGFPTKATRNRILVQNPETLYGFGKSA
jgi:hypothetical protein